MGLTRLAIHRPLTVFMGILALVLMGAVAYTYLHVDRLPPVSIGVVSASASLPNASAENVERGHRVRHRPTRRRLRSQPGGSRYSAGDGARRSPTPSGLHAAGRPQVRS